MSDNMDNNTEATEDGRGWKNALKLFIEQNKGYGDLLTHKWLYDAFEIPQPEPTMQEAEATKLKMRFLNEFNPFQSDLLHEYQMDLRNEYAKGYLVVKPEDQTRLAQEDFAHDLKRITRKTGARLTNTNYSKLTPRQQQENTDAIARFSKLRGMIQQQLPRSFDTKDPDKD